MSTFRQKVQATTNWVKPDPEDLAETPRKGRRPATRSRQRPAAPVTAHRLFPAFAAMWFAALFGLGGLAVPGSLLGALVLKTGLPALVPAAAPPLGFTAHVLLAFALTVFGAALGLALALRLRPGSEADERPVVHVAPAPAPVAPVSTAPEADTAYKVRARDAHPDAPPRRPLVLTEALGEPLAQETTEPEPEPVAALLRRKPRPIAGDSLGDATPYIPEYTPGGTGVIRPLDLSALYLDDPIEAPSFAEPEPVAVEAIAVPVEPEPQPAPEPAAIPAAPVLLAATPQLPVGFAAAQSEASEGKRSPVAGAPLENLGLVQLIERLALAIAEQKAANEAVIAADNAAEPSAAEAEPELEAGPFSRPHIASPAGQVADVPPIGSAREAILRRLGAIAAGEPIDDADSAASARLFTRPVPVTGPVASSSDAVVPLRPVEPAVPARSLAASGSMAPVEADEALRSALATLQRMTARG